MPRVGDKIRIPIWLRVGDKGFRPRFQMLKMMFFLYNYTLYSLYIQVLRGLLEE